MALSRSGMLEGFLCVMCTACNGELLGGIGVRCWECVIAGRCFTSLRRPLLLLATTSTFIANVGSDHGDQRRRVEVLTSIDTKEYTWSLHV